MADENKNAGSEILEAVGKEIKTLGDNVGKNHEELQKNFKKLKEVVDRQGEDSYDKNFIDKLATDITLRQDDLDKKNAEAKAKADERIDGLEVILHRPSMVSGSKDENYDKLKQWVYETRASKKNPVKATEEIDFANMTKAYDQYKKSFVDYLRIDEKLMPYEDMKSLSVGVDPDGGYTVTPAMSNRIITRLYEIDPIRQLAGTETISTDSLDLLVDYGEAGADWEGETVLTDDNTTPDWKKKSIVTHALSTRPKATQQLLEDSSINIETWLANKVADKFARTEGAAFVTGDGIGKPRGMLTYANGTTYGTVEQTGMGAAAALTADGFYNIKYSLKEFYLNSGTWLMNRLTVKDAAKLKDAAGDYLWKPGLASDIPATLLGLPVRMSTSVPIVAANSLSVILADFASAYLIVDRIGISVQRDPYTQKPFVEFYTRKRVGGDLVDYDSIKIGKISV